MTRLSIADEEKFISQTFSNFFNSYTKAFNKRHNRNGSLFSPNFKQKRIDKENYLQQLILYVHLNPIHHNICDDYSNYQYSSYNALLSNKITLLKRKEVIELFNDLDNFKYTHHVQKIKTEIIDEFIKDDY